MDTPSQAGLIKSLSADTGRVDNESVGRRGLGEASATESTRQRIYLRLKADPAADVTRGAMMIVVVDYGMGNLASIVNMIRKVGGQARLSQGPDDIETATKLILPGVGAFDHGMASLHERGYVDLLTRKVVTDRVPVLGICLGMQLLTRRSEEGVAPGLGWIDGETIRFKFGADAPRLKIPHMGWNTLTVSQPHPLFPDPEKPRRFYFVHSYHVCCRDPANVLTTTQYGFEFTSAVVKDNIMGTQFHPEKSLRYGMELMQHFVRDVPAA